MKIYAKIININIQKCLKKKKKYSIGEKSMKVIFITYADTECLLEETDTCHSNSEKLSAIKINKPRPCDNSLFTNFSFNTAKIRHDYYSYYGN